MGHLGNSEVGRIATNASSALMGNNAENYSIAYGSIRDFKLTDISFTNTKASMESLAKGLAQQINASYAKVDSEAFAVDNTMKSISRDDKTAVDNSYQTNFAKNLDEAKR